MLKFLRSLIEEESPIQDPMLPQLAACALMLEVCWADHDIAPEEMSSLRDTLATTFSLPEDDIDALIDEARALHDDAVGVHPYTSIINEHLDASTKREIVFALWRIAYADSEIAPLEEHMIRRIADLIYVSHKDFIAGKIAARGA